MVVYEADKLESDRIVCIDDHNPYFNMLRDSWGSKLRAMFDSLEDPVWNGEATTIPLKTASKNAPLKKISTPEEKLI